MTTSSYIPTITSGGKLHSPETTIEGALAQWSRNNVIEALDEPRDVLVREYIDNGYDRTGYYLYPAKRVNIRMKSNKRSRTWFYSEMIFARDESARRPE